MRQKQKRRKLRDVIRQAQNRIMELERDNNRLKLYLNVEQQRRERAGSFVIVKGRYEDNLIVVTVGYDIKNFSSLIMINPLEYQGSSNKEFYCKRQAEMFLKMLTGRIVEDLAVEIGGALEHSSERIDYSKVIPLRFKMETESGKGWRDLAVEDLHSRKCMFCGNCGISGCTAYTPDRREVCQYFIPHSVNDYIGVNFSYRGAVNDVSI